MQKLRAIFTSAGFNIWLVGGAVRDFLAGQEPKDMDFATDASPAEQVALYEAAGLRYIETGLQHGTVTVLIEDEPFEITTLRIDVETDGRHAEVEFTRNIQEDLARRDLTINAMAMDMEGNLIDPFAGADDLRAGRVRFVGNAEERMREDYLRILRFFRFHARVTGANDIDPEAAAAIANVAEGLKQISVERVWMEVSKIVTGPWPSKTLMQMRQLGITDIIGLPFTSTGLWAWAHIVRDSGVTNPASVIGLMMSNPQQVEALATRWKWSSEERARAKFVNENAIVVQTPRFKEMLVDGVPFAWVADVMRANNIDPQPLAKWPVPKMPVTGGDLIAAGMKPGPEMGTMLKQMKEQWMASEFQMTRDDLMRFTEDRT